MKKILKYVTVVISLLCISVSLCACNSGETSTDIYPSGGTVNLHTEEQAEYLNLGYDSISLFANGDKEQSRPKPLPFKWTKATHGGQEAQKYLLEISEDKEFKSALQIETNENSVDVYNLKISTKYFWRVKTEFPDGTKKIAKISEFSTAGVAPRNLYIDGVTNVRDLGGWNTSSGGNVKQGLIYRCGRLNKSDTEIPEIEITSDGIETMRKTLGIKSEIDLRMVDNGETGGITKSPLGNDVNYYNVPMGWASGVSLNYLTDDYSRTKIKEMFALLADESNYPIIYHCNIGTDRTGLFAFLINGLLGVGIEDLYKDYLFSNFGNIGGARHPSGLQTYLNTVTGFNGINLSEKIENCLLDMGITATEISSVKDILTEK